MNWSLFFFAGFVGVTAGVLLRRHQPTRIELWTIVMARIVVALLLAAMIPDGADGQPATGTAFVVLAVSEAGRGVEVLASAFLDQLVVRREARKWLPR